MTDQQSCLVFIPVTESLQREFARVFSPLVARLVSFCKRDSIADFFT